MFNYNNRSVVAFRWGNVSATAEQLVLIPNKKVRVHALSIGVGTAIAASQANFLTFRAKKDGVDVGADVDSKGGIAARGALDLNLGDDGIELEKGEALSVNMTKAGTAVLSGSIINADVEVIGN